MQLKTGIAAALCSWLLMGCPPIMDGEQTRTVYFIENNTSHSVYLVFQSKLWGDSIRFDTTEAMGVGATAEITGFWDWGIYFPDGFFSGLKVFRKSDSVLILDVDPVINSHWKMNKRQGAGKEDEIWFTLPIPVIQDSSKGDG